MPVREAAPSGLPIVGHLPSFRQDPLAFFAGCMDESGAPVRCRLYGDGFVLNDPEDVRHVLVRNTANYVKSRRVAGTRGAYPRARSLLTTEGLGHLRKRRAIQGGFRGALVANLVERTRANTRELAQSWSDGTEVDVHEAMTTLSRRNTLETLLGPATDERVDVLSAATAARTRAFERHFFSVFPAPEYLPTKLNLRYQAATRGLRAAIADEISARRARPANGDDLLSLLMTVTYEDGEPLSDRELTDEVLTLSVTGYDGVSEGLTWTLLLLARHPEVDAALAAEAGLGAAHDESPIATSVVRESLRLFPPTWIFVRIACGEDRLPSGARIRPGSMVYLCPYIVHRNPRYWPEPDRFIPDRFAGGATATRPRYAYFPFGGGPHVCIGETLAVAQIVTVLSGIAPGWRLTLDHLREVSPRAGLSLRPRGPLRMRAAYRRRPASTSPSSHLAGSSTAPAAGRVPQIECTRVRLRRWREADSPALAAILGDTEVLRYFGTGPVHRAKRAVAAQLARVSDLEARRMVARLQRHWDEHGFGEWALEERATGELIGKVGLVHTPDWRLGPTQVEIGWTLARRAWGRGLATESARAALDDAFGRVGLECVISIARRDNSHSLRVMDKLGMRREGATRWKGSNMVWCSIAREAWLDRQESALAGAHR